jgi:hypothetical protein
MIFVSRLDRPFPAATSRYWRAKCAWTDFWTHRKVCVAHVGCIVGRHHVVVSVPLIGWKPA